ncbi:MAG: acyl-CoA dehydratase activase-related protein [Tannerella sp.]|jgi:predicted CoA-substrate-specific enzyme activase|nr:acyl-CoA dehydratase activase-related protein [Tannerella sp.]
MESAYKVGIDAGSTTMKFIVLDTCGEIIYKAYRRHKADIQGTLISEVNQLKNLFGEARFRLCFTGSAGIGIVERIGMHFVQEVVAAVDLVKKHFPDIRTLFDIGGEDSKMVFFEKSKHPEIRMNGSCAGGTGAFIDQMASLMQIPVEKIGEEAGKHEKIYPIASRCGVFAKTDIQNLISRNMPVADIAASTLHAVALQTITTLAHGYDITPPVLCVGGPLTYLPALRDIFCQLLNFNSEDLILPENSEYFPAWGAALHISDDFKTFGLEELLQLLARTTEKDSTESLPALFEHEAAYLQWKKNRKIKPLHFIPFTNQSRIECFLGIDSGSTTTKIVVIDRESRILFHFYGDNAGNPLGKVSEGLHLFYRQAKEKGVEINVLSSAVTGYGEDLIKSALNLDYGIVETMAHLSGAQYVDPEVSFVLDIGGQDMKSMFVEKGIIANIELNEACSSGCGSFLQNFASTMHLDLNEFSQKACLSSQPCNLGSRCTVFMNSKVKQSLRKNAGVDDIAAGLAYSVVKNCLFKVLKINNLNKLGDHIVVQGGAFRNDAVYRALELLSEKSVGSTDHPELMGAFGAALYAENQWLTKKKESSFPGETALQSINSLQTSELQCKGCTNHCSILKFRFGNGNVCHAGNKCEKFFFSSHKSQKKGYNAFDKKNEILFGSRREKDAALSPAPAGVEMRVIGIPRVLNMFENYPFWHALFTGCGFRVVLSPESNLALYHKGVGSVMSDNICFPAKLAHGHILSLIEEKVDRIFYPLIAKEEKEFEKSSNSWNCPVVSGYPDVIRSAIDPEKKYGIPFDTPVIGFNDDKVLQEMCWKYMEKHGISKKTFRTAFKQALLARYETKNELIRFQAGLLEKAIQSDQPVFIITGRPYHADPLIHQKTGQSLSDLGVTVLTDDVFRQEANEAFDKLNIVSQWSYPNRIIQSALRVAKLPHNIQLIQLNSFGCGPDSFYTDEASAILKSAGKNLTVIRIDEITSPGSIRLRLRSLVESLLYKKTEKREDMKPYSGYRVPYTKEDRKKTILVPWLADFISPFLPAIGDLAGYSLVNLPKPDRFSAELGLKYGHNEVCYPSTLVLGDIIKTLQSGTYDLNNVVIAMTQTGGQCRATNYISQIKTGLERAGFSGIPIIALTTGETFQNEQKAFRLPWMKLANIAIYATLYGDALQQMFASVSVREKQPGETRRLFDFYMERGTEAIRNHSHKSLLAFLEQAVADFNHIPVHEGTFSPIGLIGEIYVKYNSYAQAYISEWLRGKGQEVKTPPIIDFIMQYFVNTKVNSENGITRKSRLQRALNPLLWKYMHHRIRATEAIMQSFRYYQPSESIYVKAEYASEILSLSNQFGEGWAIAAEIAHYARLGINKVVCIQPFGCIANHIVAKGIEKRLKTLYPDMNLLYLDIDSGAAEVNLQNRLHFMI